MPHTCEVCNDGLYANGTECTACPTNCETCVLFTGILNCITCSSGYELNDLGSSTGARCLSSGLNTGATGAIIGGSVGGAVILIILSGIYAFYLKATAAATAAKPLPVFV
jgi:hypothetical protein